MSCNSSEIRCEQFARRLIYLNAPNTRDTMGEKNRARERERGVGSRALMYGMLVPTYVHGRVHRFKDRADQRSAAENGRKYENSSARRMETKA